MRSVFFAATVALVAAFVLTAATPAQSQTNADLLVVGEHQIVYQKSRVDADASVTESVMFHNSGTSAFEGVLTMDLDPDATVTAFFFVDANRTPLGDAGVVQDEAPPSEPMGDHVRYSFDLSAYGASFPADTTNGLNVIYTLPAEDRSFTRAFTLETPRLVAAVGSVPGLRPESEATPLEPIGTSWSYTLSPGSGGPFAAGDTFAFEWVDAPVAMEPLGVTVTASGGDPLRLRADTFGGIPPYTVTWDLDGDGDCNDAEGVTANLDTSEPGTHTATACVVDSAAPATERTFTYQATTRQGATVTTGPTGWVLGAIGLLVGALLVYGLVQGGLLGGGKTGGTTQSSGPSYGAEGKEMLELRQRVMVASLKELEIAKKKGEVADGLYTPLKAELKQDTVRVMREIEKRKSETV